MILKLFKNLYIFKINFKRFFHFFFFFRVAISMKGETFKYNLLLHWSLAAGRGQNHRQRSGQKDNIIKIISLATLQKTKWQWISKTSCSIPRNSSVEGKHQYFFFFFFSLFIIKVFGLVKKHKFKFKLSVGRKLFIRQYINTDFRKTLENDVALDRFMAMIFEFMEFKNALVQKWD